MRVHPGVVVLILLLVALAVLIGINLERVEKTVPLPQGPEARANPLLAAERFFNEMGLPAEGTDNLSDLPPTDHVIVLAMERRITTRTEAERLVDWIADGGLLVLTPPIENGELSELATLDPLTEALEITPISYDDVPSRTVTDVQLGDEEPAEVLFYDTLGVGYQVVDGELSDGFSLLWSEYGEGAYVVACDLKFLDNQELGLHDHALFAWRLAGVQGDRKGIVLVRGQHDVSFLGLLAGAAWLALIVGALGLITWAWHSAQRFGPLIPEPEPASRSIMEHVEAAGRFLWQHRRHDALLAPARSNLFQQLLARRPAMAGLDEDARCRALSRGTGLGAEEIRLALFDECPHKRDEYTKRMRILERLRRGL